MLPRPGMIVVDLGDAALHVDSMWHETLKMP
jgi:hypothetical protein